jgi:hypothetical protein
MQRQDNEEQDIKEQEKGKKAFLALCACSGRDYEAEGT